jgi:4-hydroxy-tetrahydrodipicolinate reductase
LPPERRPLDQQDEEQDVNTIIFGDGNLGRAIAAAFREDGTEPLILGRPAGGRHDPTTLAASGSPNLVLDATRGEAVLGNVEAALAAGCRGFVIATTAWEADRGAVEDALLAAGASAVVAPNLSVGAAVFLRLVERAAALYGAVGGFDPYVVEWHRRSKRDRPSGTARELLTRLAAGGRIATDAVEVASIRAGSSPGMHLVGFDAAGESVELRLTARDRSAYAAGALAAATWLSRAPRQPGFHPFDAVVDDLTTTTPALAATA